MAGVVEDHGARLRDQALELVRVLDRDEHVVLAPDDQRGRLDLRQPVAEVVARQRVERVHEAGLAGAAHLLVHQVGRDPRRMPEDEVREEPAQPRPRDHEARLCGGRRAERADDARERQDRPPAQVRDRDPRRGDEARALDPLRVPDARARRSRSRPSSCRRRCTRRGRAARRARRPGARSSRSRSSRAASRSGRTPAGPSRCSAASARSRGGSRASSASCPERPWMKTTGGPSPEPTST